MRALPRELMVGDFFSGTGSFYKIVDAMMGAIHKIMPEAADGIEVSGRLSLW